MSENEEKPTAPFLSRRFHFDVNQIGVDPARLGRFVEEVTRRAIDERLDVIEIASMRSSIAITCHIRDTAFGGRVREGDLEPDEVERRWTNLAGVLQEIVRAAEAESRYAEPPLGEGPRIRVCYHDAGGWAPRHFSVLVSPETYARWENAIAEHGGLRVFIRSPIDRLMEQFSATVVTTETHLDGHYFAATVDARISARAVPLSERFADALDRLFQKSLVRIEAGCEPTS